MKRFWISSLVSVLLAVGIGLATTQPVRSNLPVGLYTSGGGGGSCSASTAWFARAGTLNGTHTTAYDNLICGLVTDGVWAKLDNFYVLATQTTTAALLNLTSSSFSLTANGSPNFSADNGYLGVDGSSTVFLDTGYNASTSATNYALNTAAFGVWSLTNAQSANVAIGAQNVAATSATFIAIRFTGDVYFAGVNTATNGSAAVSDSTGFWEVSRTSSTNTDTYRNGSADGSVTGITPVAIPDVNMYILARNNGGSAAGGVGYRIAMAFFGGALNSTDAGNFYTRGCTYLTAVRGSC